MIDDRAIIIAKTLVKAENKDKSNHATRHQETADQERTSTLFIHLQFMNIQMQVINTYDVDMIYMRTRRATWLHPHPIVRSSVEATDGCGCHVDGTGSSRGVVGPHPTPLSSRPATERYQGT